MLLIKSSYHCKVQRNFLVIVLPIIVLLFTLPSTCFSQASDWQWANRAGAIGSDYGNDIKVDPEGNIYVTGTFNESATFGSTTLSSAGSSDIFMVKYDHAGNVLWAKSFGGNSLDVCYSLYVDASGNILLTGYFRSEEITFGDVTLYNPNSDFGYDQYYLAKCDASGNVVWATTSDGLGNMNGNSVTMDNSGNIIVLGWFDGSNISFESITLLNAGILSSDIFIIKYNAAGEPLWAKTAGGSGYDIPSGITADDSGNLYFTGYFESSTIDFETISLSNTGSRDVFVAKYDALGNPVWASSATGNGDDGGAEIVIDVNSNLLLTGSSSSESITFGSVVLTGNDYDKIFTVKYDDAGNVLWADVFGGDSNDEAYGLTTDNQGSIFITGEFESSNLQFGATELINTSSEYTDIYIAKLDTDGHLLWAKSAGGSDDDEASAIAIDNDSNSYITGSFYSSTLTFGTTQLNNSDDSENSADLFISKLGNTSWINEQFTGSLIIYPNPASNMIQIKGAEGSIIEISDINGRFITSLAPQQSTPQIDVSNFLAGIYIVKTIKQNSLSFTKFIKE